MRRTPPTTTPRRQPVSGYLAADRLVADGVASRFGLVDTTCGVVRRVELPADVDGVFRP